MSMPERQADCQKFLPGIERKPWGFERIIESNDTYVVKELYVKPRSRLSLQYHIKKVENMMLVSGKGFLILGNGKRYNEVEMDKFVPYHMYPWRIHRLFTEDEDCLVVEVSSTELKDVIRIEDDYGRA